MSLCQVSLCDVVALYTPFKDLSGRGGEGKNFCLFQESNLAFLHSYEITLINIPIHS